MLQQQEQVVEVVKEEETEIVELSQADLQWIGGGSGVVITDY
jgi:UDP-N-acetylenolpyruvoylglucosamine reductase